MKTGIGEGIALKCALAAFSFAAGFAAPAATAEEDPDVKDGVHGYTPNNYVQPPEPEVRERLEWFKDQKLALMMHWGIYSTIGIKESWCLVDSLA